MKIQIKSSRLVSAHELGAYTVMAWDAEGRSYYLDQTLTFRQAESLVLKVNERKELNPDLWICHTPYGTDAWMVDGMEDRQIEDERFGY